MSHLSMLRRGRATTENGGADAGLIAPLCGRHDANLPSLMVRSAYTLHLTILSVKIDASAIWRFRLELRYDHGAAWRFSG